MTTLRQLLTPNGTMKSVHLPTVCAAWCSTSPQIVEKNFKVSGISNEMNSSEDFVISDTDNRSEGNDNDETA
jgi:hypothetical protein